MLLEKRIDGLILVASGADGALAELLSTASVPMVLVDREVAGVEADFIESNHEEGGYLATRYLIGLGHRDIACVAGPEHLQPSRDRVAGYRQALGEAGIEADPAWLIYSDFTSEGGFTAFGTLLQLPAPPTAVFASNDLMAIGGLCAAAEAKVRVPQDLSVMGYDDIALASYSTPRLTTMAQPKSAMGEKIASLLVERIGGGTQAIKRELLQTMLVERQSTARFLARSKA